MIRPVVHLDPSAVVHNVQRLRDVVAPADVWVTVKANAYGHGLIEFSRLAREAGVTGFCTLDIPTGLRLREDGFDGDLFAWLIPTSAPLVEALRSGIQLGVHALWQLRAIADAARAVGTTAAVHLKAETGLHRGGIDPEDWDAVISEAAALEGAGLIRVEAIWTHMSETAHEFDVEAVARLHRAIDRAEELGVTPKRIHAAASGVAFDYPEARFDLVRIGICSYGATPFEEGTGEDLGLRPVMTLTATVIDVHGDTATVAAGFGDGLPTRLSKEAWIRIGDRKCPISSVDVDEMTVRIPAPGDSATPGDPAIRAGDPATLLGPGAASVEDWSTWTGWAVDEVFAMLSERLERRPEPSADPS